MADGNNLDIPIIDLQNDLSIRDSLIHQVRQACEVSFSFVFDIFVLV